MPSTLDRKEMVDQDLAEPETWEALRELQEARGWGDFEQAQVGHDALLSTYLGR